MEKKKMVTSKLLLVLALVFVLGLVPAALAAEPDLPTLPGYDIYAVMPSDVTESGNGYLVGDMYVYVPDSTLGLYSVSWLRIIVPSDPVGGVYVNDEDDELDDIYNSINRLYVYVPVGYQFQFVDDLADYEPTYMPPVFQFVRSDAYSSVLAAVLAVFSFCAAFFGPAVSVLLPLFWSGSGLTFMGVLAVAGLAFSVVFLVVGIIQRFLHFRG